MSTFDQALEKMQGLCARSEQCSGDLRRKLTAWDLSPAQREEILQSLAVQNWFDDARYIRAYVHDKAGLQGWGRLKIQQKLLEKRLSPTLIREALDKLDPTQEVEDLHRILTQKARSLKAASPALLRQKLLRFAAGRGFAYATVQKVLKSMEAFQDVEEWDSEESSRYF